MDSRELCYAIASASAAALIYIYYGYYALLKLIAWRKSAASAAIPNPPPTITVLVTAHNEEAVIGDRIANILECDYRLDRLEVIVASDGSTDRTDSIVRGHPSPQVRLFRPEARSGKSDTQNQAVKSAMGEIVLFTDAGTRFAKGFLQEIVRPFADPGVGGVDGHLTFQPFGTGHLVAEAQGYYWRQELMIRSFESVLGILAVSAGACLAVRKNLLCRIPSTVGEDCTIPLDVVRAGYRMVHQPTALAFDTIESTNAAEFKSRARMTLRNLQGTLMYPDLLNPFKHPGISWALWSHKLLRWCSPLFLVAWVSSSFSLLAVAGRWPVALPAIVFASCSLVLLLCPKLRDVRGLRTLWSFTVANAGFAVGLTRALTGKTITAYRN